MKTSNKEIAKYILNCYPKQVQECKTDKNMIKFFADRMVIYSKGKISHGVACRIIEEELNERDKRN
jgi:hypothetical protein